MKKLLLKLLCGGAMAMLALPTSAAIEFDGDQLYIVGQINNWNIESSDYTLSKTQSGIYTGTIQNLTAENFNFRFYTKLESNGWGSDGVLPSIGARSNDGDNLEIAFWSKVYNGTCVPGKGNWKCETWPGGDLTITVNLNDQTVQFVAGDNVTITPPDLYVVGSSVNGESNIWSFDDDNRKMTYNSSNNTYTWTGESLGSGFKIGSAGWGVSIGSDAATNKLTFGEPFSYYNNGASTDISFKESNKMVITPTISLNLNNETITLTGESYKVIPPAKVEIEGGSPWSTLTTLEVDPSNEYLFTGSISGLTTDTEFKVVIDGAYYGGSSFHLYSNLDVTIPIANGGNMKILNIQEGSVVNVTVDWENSIITFSSSQQPEYVPNYITVLGNFNDWGEEVESSVLEAYQLKPSSDNANIYTGSFNVTMTEDEWPSFKLACDGEWNVNFGSDGEPIAIYSDNPYVAILYTSGEDIEVSNWVNGTMTVSFNFTKQEITVTGSNQPAAPVIPDITDAPDNLYIIGDITGNSWNTVNPTALTNNNDGTFSIAGVILEATGTNQYANFSFINTISSDWSLINDGEHRYGPAVNNQLVSTAASTNFYLAGDMSWTILPGNYNFTLNFNTGVLTITGTATNGINSIDSALNGEEVIYNLQGVRVDRNHLNRGIYIINGKKVLVK